MQIKRERYRRQINTSFVNQSNTLEKAVVRVRRKTRKGVRGLTVIIIPVLTRPGN